MCVIVTLIKSVKFAAIYSKMQEFTVVAEICKFCKSRNSRKKLTALDMYVFVH